MRQSTLARPSHLATVLMISLFAFAYSVILPSPASAAVLAVDKVVSRHQAAPSTSIVSPAFTTTQAGELLIAFVSADGPAVSRGQQFTGVTGGGLTWRLRQRTNLQYGTAEIWQAVASGILTNARVTASHPATIRHR